MRLGVCGLTSACFILVANAFNGQDNLSADADFFEAKVRPLLIAKCQECHGSTKPKSGLRLESREAILRIKEVNHVDCKDARTSNH